MFFFKSKRKKYYSEPFQVAYGVWLCGVGVFCFALMGFLAYVSVYRAVENRVPAALQQDLLNVALAPSAVFITLEVLVPLVCLLVMLFGLGIVGTHKIAGPIFAIKRHLKRVHDRTARGPLKLRRGDYLHDVSQLMNEVIESSDRRRLRAVESLKEVALKAGSPELSLELQKITQILEK